MKKWVYYLGHGLAYLTRAMQRSKRCRMKVEIGYPKDYSPIFTNVYNLSRIVDCIE